MGLGSSPPRSSANPSGRSSAPLPIALSPLPAALCSPPTARPPRASGYRRGSESPKVSRGRAPKGTFRRSFKSRIRSWLFRGRGCSRWFRPIAVDCMAFFGWIEDDWSIKQDWTSSNSSCFPHQIETALLSWGWSLKVLLSPAMFTTFTFMAPRPRDVTKDVSEVKGILLWPEVFQGLYTFLRHQTMINGLCQGVTHRSPARKWSTCFQFCIKQQFYLRLTSASLLWPKSIVEHASHTLEDLSHRFLLAFHPLHGKNSILGYPEIGCSQYTWLQYGSKWGDIALP